MNEFLKSSLVLAALLSVISTPAGAQPVPTPATGSVADGGACSDEKECATKGAKCTAPATPPGGAKVCTPPAPPAAVKKGKGETCSVDTDCDSGYCEGSPKVCADTLDVGEACARPEACTSAQCLKGNCVECASDADCVGTGEKCQSNACVVPAGSLKDGDTCTDNTQCSSGICSDPTSTGAKTCQPKAAPPVVPVPPPAPPKSTAPTPPPAPAPPPPSLEEVCGSFPMSDPMSADAFDRIAGCVWMATAQACGSSRTQFWGDCAVKAQELVKGKTGSARVQSFYNTGLGLVVEKYGNRLSGRFMDAKELGALTADLPKFAAALKGGASQGDLMRLALGTVTAGSRAPAARRTAAGPRCEAGWTLLATTRDATFGSRTGNWLCHRSGEEGPGSWKEPEYGPAPVAPVPAPVTAPIPPSTSSR